MTIQELKVWAENPIQDGVAKNYQRRDLRDEEFMEGWARLAGLTYQEINQLFYLLSSYSSPLSVAPYQHYIASNAVPSTALEMNGQTISVNDVPELYAYYGATLPDRTGELPTGWTYIVRKH